MFCCFAAVPEASGSIPEGLPEGYFALDFYAGSGSFRKDSGSGTGSDSAKSYLNFVNVPAVTRRICLQLPAEGKEPALQKQASGPFAMAPVPSSSLQVTCRASASDLSIR